MLSQLNEDQLVEIVNLYHIAKILHDTRHKRMIYASNEFNKLHPNISKMSAYKAVDRMQTHK